MLRMLTIGSALHIAAVVTLTAQAPTRTVWDGVFTAEQSARGRSHYATACARCHGGNLEGGMGRSLVGTAFWNKWREQSVADLLEYVSKNMPMGQTSTTTLSPPVYADLVAYLLSSNDLPAGQAELTAASVVDVRIVPKGGGTGELPPTTLARVVGCLAPQGGSGAAATDVGPRPRPEGGAGLQTRPDWQLTKASRPERVKSISEPMPASPPAGDRQYALKFVLQPLGPLAGHRVAVVGILLGEGGADGINVSTVTSIAPACN
jgi:S-disulfanyl-L-cysteine oxidoreductase SoxD